MGKCYEDIQSRLEDGDFRESASEDMTFEQNLTEVEKEPMQAPGGRENSEHED